jgi:hypothetical protein
MTGSQPLLKLQSLHEMDRTACMTKTMAQHSFHTLPCLAFNLYLKLRERREMDRRTLPGENYRKQAMQYPFTAVTHRVLIEHVLSFQSLSYLLTTTTRSRCVFLDLQKKCLHLNNLRRPSATYEMPLQQIV